MRPSPRLEATITTGLRLHPGVQLALRFLQVPTQELTTLIEQELLVNPLLEMEESAPEESPPATSPRDPDGDGAWSQNDEPPLPRGVVEAWPELDCDRAAEPTLGEQLAAQLALRPAAPAVRTAAEYLLGCLDARGYLAISIEEAARELGLSEAEVDSGLALLQSLEPAGIAARDLKECLLLQLDARGEGEDLATRIVREQYDLMLHGRFAEIARALGLARAQVDQAALQLRRLSPHPGRLADPEEVRYIYPDLIVEKVGTGYEVCVNDRAAPRLKLSSVCRRLLQESSAGSEAQAFLRERVRAARWMIQALDRRRDTLLRVMRSIVAEQREFLEHGIAQLRPMTLRSIAGQVGLHESTVARVTAQKYAQTPRGLFPLKFFFSSRLSTDGGSEVSARSVRERIRDLIAGEDPIHPWSDEAVARRLREEGVLIARRTVAKYREQMNIERAQLRRRGAPGSDRSEAA